MAVLYVNKGTFTAGQAGLTVPVPTGYNANNLFVLLIESANQAITTPSGWTQVTGSPQGTGTAAAAGGVRLAVFWKVVAASEASVAVADSGDHTTAQIFEFSGVDTTNPIAASAGQVNASGVTFTFPSITTTQENQMILLCCANDRDLSSTANLNPWTNVNLASITERHDQTSNLGVGGGLGLATAIKAVIGSTGTSTATNAAANTSACITIALKERPTTIITLATAIASPLAKALSIVLIKSLSLGVAPAAPVALPVTVQKLITLNIGAVVAAPLAYPVTAQKFKTASPGTASVTPLAYPVTINRLKTVSIGAAPAAPVARPVTVQKLKTLYAGCAAVAPLAYQVMAQKLKLASVATASVTPLAYPVTINRLKTVCANVAPAAQVAWPVTVQKLKTLNIGCAAAVPSAYPVTAIAGLAQVVWFRSAISRLFVLKAPVCRQIRLYAGITRLLVYSSNIARVIDNQNYDFMNEMIFKDRSFSIRFTDVEDLTGATKIEVHYLKPDGITKGSLPATAETVTGLIARVPSDTNNQAGVWQFWPYVEDASAEGMEGNPVKVTIYNTP